MAAPEVASACIVGTLQGARKGTARLPPVRGRVIAFAALALLAPSIASGSSSKKKPPPPTPPPVQVYLDFTTHGRLTRKYPRALLQKILDDASLNQYGDPVVMSRLRRAVRQQLAGVAPTGARTVTGGDSVSGSTPKPRAGGRPAAKGSAPPEDSSDPEPAVAAGEQDASSPLFGALPLGLLSAFVLGAITLGFLAFRARRSRG
jgi:hypothetical protein